MTSNAHQYERTLFENIEPKYRYDGKEDFSAWKKRAYDRLWERLGLSSFVKPEDDLFTIGSAEETQYGIEYDFSFQSENGYIVPGFIMLPKNHGGKVLTAAICLQGHSTGMHISRGRERVETDKAFLSDPDRMYAVRAVNEGFAAVCIEQRYMGVTGHDETVNKPGCVRGRSMPSLLINRCAIGERVWDVMRLIDVIEKHFDNITTDGLICLGNSGGGTATYYSACIDDRIKYALACCGVCTYYDSIVSIRHCQCNYIPGIALDFDMGDIGGLVAPRGLAVINGAEDREFPKHGVDKVFEQIKRLYEAAGVPDMCINSTGNAGHRFYANEAWDAYRVLKSQGE